MPAELKGKGMKKITLALAGLLFASISFAAVGDFQNEHAGKYGKGTKLYSSIVPGTDSYAYKYKNWNIIQAYVNDRVIKAKYSRAMMPLQMIPEEVQSILEAEGRGGKWTLVAPSKNVAPLSGFQPTPLVRWTCTNGKTAELKQSIWLEISSPKLEAYLAKIKKNEVGERKKNIPAF
jgi:hypothetical protein